MILCAIFESQQNLYSFILLVAAALGLGIYFRISDRRADKGRADQLQDKYRVLDRETLEKIPDEELVDAVIANIMAQVDPKNPDVYRIVPLLSRDRCAVYSVWLTCAEIRTVGLDAFLKSPSGRFAELAADGFELIGAVACSEALREIIASDSTETEPVKNAEASLNDAITKEAPLDICKAFIKNNLDEFID